jgi:hypothetical protein
MGDRTRARALAAEGTKREDPVGWFDELYREAGRSFPGTTAW